MRIFSLENIFESAGVIPNKQCQILDALFSQYNYMPTLELLFEESFIKQAITEFVRKVYLLLENNTFVEAMSWDFDNHTIVIKDANKLINDVLPVVFKQNTLKSFIRQLNMYNFRKIKNGRDANHMYFRNPYFHRGNIQELIFIKRKQRGYIEKSRLENIESKTMLQKYNIFCDGVMNRLKEQFNVLCGAYPKVGVELTSLLKTISQQSVVMDPEPQNLPLIGSDRMITTMLQSMRSFYQLPPKFNSDLSILADLGQNSQAQ